MTPPPGCAPEPHQPQLVDGGPVLGPTRCRPLKQQLFQAQLTAENVPFGQPELDFQIPESAPAGARCCPWCWAIFRQGVDDGIPKGFPLLEPMRGSFLDVVGRVLHKNAHHMLAFRSHVRVSKLGNTMFKNGFRKVAILGIVVCAFQVVGVECNGDVARMWSPVPGRALKSGNRSKAKLTFQNCPATCSV